MHALAEPPVSPTVVGAEDRDEAVVVLDQRRVVVRLRDGETILVGGSPSYEDALVLAQKTILKLADVGEGEWPMLGDRFINPDAIVSVDVSSAGRSSPDDEGAAGLSPGLRLVPPREPPPRERLCSPHAGRSAAARGLRRQL